MASFDTQGVRIYYSRFYSNTLFNGILTKTILFLDTTATIGAIAEAI